RHTRSKRDWSSDVCSSDLTFCEATSTSSAAEHPQAESPSEANAAALSPAKMRRLGAGERDGVIVGSWGVVGGSGTRCVSASDARSEERRVGKEGRGVGGRA